MKNIEESAKFRDLARTADFRLKCVIQRRIKTEPPDVVPDGRSRSVSPELASDSEPEMNGVPDVVAPKERADKKRNGEIAPKPAAIVTPKADSTSEPRPTLTPRIVPCEVPTCGQMFTNTMYMKRHSRKFHVGDSRSVENGPSSKGEKRKPIKEESDSESEEERSIQIKKQKIISKSKSSTSSGTETESDDEDAEEDVKCKQCPLKFRSQRKLEQHERTHKKSHKCSQCSKTFELRRQFLDHVKANVCKGVLPYNPKQVGGRWICCGSWFKNDHSFSTHRYTWHPDTIESKGSRKKRRGRPSIY